MTEIIAFDIDLNRIHAWSTKFGKVCYNAKAVPTHMLLPHHDLILIEVASNVFYDRRQEVVFNTAKWAIYNAMTAGRIYEYIQQHNPRTPVLVAPSSLWTLGYEEAVRHAMACVTGEDNHDLRETRAMIFFYKHSPSKWVPFESYFQNLSTAGKAGKPKTKKARNGSNPAAPLLAP